MGKPAMVRVKGKARIVASTIVIKEKESEPFSGELLFASFQDELILKIMNYLLPKDLTRLCLVCRQWNSIFNGGIGFGITQTDEYIDKNIFTTPLKILNSSLVSISAHGLKIPLTKRRFPHYKTVGQIFFDFGNIVLKTRMEMALNMAERKRDFFLGDTWKNDEGSTVSADNFIWLLKNCKELNALFLNTGAMSCFDSENICPKIFTGISLANITVFVVSVSEEDYKPLFNGLLRLSVPALKICILQFKILVNTFTLDVCKLVFQFVDRVRGTLEILDIKNAPCFTSSLTKLKKRQRPKNLSVTQELLAVAYGLIQFQLKELRLEMKKEVNVERKLEVEFLRTLCTLSNLSLAGIPLTDITQAVRMNRETLNVLNIRDIPGHFGPNKQGVFDCSCLEGCKALIAFISEDFKLKNIRKLPPTVKFLSLVSFYYNEGPINNTEEALWLIERFRNFDTVIHLPVLDAVTVQRFIIKQGVSSGLKVTSSKGSKDHRIGLAEVVYLYKIRNVVPKRAYDWLLEEVLVMENVKKDQIAEVAAISAYCTKKLDKVLDKDEDKTKEKEIGFQFGPNVFSVSKLECKIPVKVIDLIIPYLTNPNKKICRLVSKKWNSQAEKYLNFGFWLNDQTSKWVQNSTVPMSFLAVSKMDKPLDPKKIEFGNKVNVLIFECDEKSFLADPLGKRRGTDLDNHFLPGDQSSILEANIRFILACCMNVRCLFFNKWALGNFVTSTNEKGLEYISEGDFLELRVLSVTVSGMETYHLTNLFKSEFQKLDKLILKYNYLKRTYTQDLYEDLFVFLIIHQKTLRRLELHSPPLPPDLRKGRKGKIEVKPTEAYIKISQQMHVVQFEELTVHMTSNSLKWPLGLQMLSVQRNLKKLRCTGVQTELLQKIIATCSKTLKSVEISSSESGIRGKDYVVNTTDFQSDCLANCINLRNLNLHNFVTVTGFLQHMPESLESLTISLGSVRKGDIFYLGKNLINLKAVTLQCNESFPKATFSSYFDVKVKKKSKNTMKTERLVAQLNKAKFVTFVYGLYSQVKGDDVQESCRIEEPSHHRRKTWYDDNGFIPTNGGLCGCRKH